ncbi:hypothetical protein [Streptomyces sp. NPDC001221]
MTLYRAILQFEENGPAVTGEWEDNADVARATYKALFSRSYGEVTSSSP